MRPGPIRRIVRLGMDALCSYAVCQLVAYGAIVIEWPVRALPDLARLAQSAAEPRASIIVRPLLITGPTSGK